MSNKTNSQTEEPKPSTKDNSSPHSVAFIHNLLDEYGLDPYEFRLYTHIVRRTGGKPQGVCFASLRKIAAICKMSMRKAQQSMKVLVKANLVEQNKRTGRTDEYRVTYFNTWTPREKLDKVRKDVLSGNAQDSHDFDESNALDGSNVSVISLGSNSSDESDGSGENIDVIQADQDLLSLATDILSKKGFDEQFKVSKASQYLGYRLKNLLKVEKNYQLILAQAKEALFISIPQDILKKHVLQICFWENIPYEPGHVEKKLAIIWVKPSKKQLFLDSLDAPYWNKLQVPEKTTEQVYLNELQENIYHEDSYGMYPVKDGSEVISKEEFNINNLSDNSTFLVFSDKDNNLFPSTWEVSIKSKEDLEEFVEYFSDVLMKEN
jgi:predicted transcriptional regulator